jgi:hypothetical protein
MVPCKLKNQAIIQVKETIHYHNGSLQIEKSSYNTSKRNDLAPD